MDHVLEETAAPSVLQVRTDGEIVVPEQAPGAEHFDALGRVGVDQELVSHPSGRCAGYQYSFRPPCIWRGEFAWLETRPNVVLFRLVCGPPNTTRLKMLNASARKSMRSRSDTLNVFAR